MCASVFRILLLYAISSFVTCTSGDEVSFHYIADPKENIHDDHRGNITVIPKTNLSLFCSILISKGTKVHWDATKKTKQNADNVLQVEGKNNTAVFSELRIASASSDNTAMYECFDGRGSSHNINIKVEAMCGPPPEILHSTIIAPPEKGHFEIDSIVQYSCLEGSELKGFAVAKCSLYDKTAVWFGPNHRCSQRNEEELTAAPAPESADTILSNMPECSVGSLHDVIPKGVVAHIGESLPYGYVLQLSCDQGETTCNRSKTSSIVLKGSNVATCSYDGKWKIEPDIKCVPGCARLRKKNGSELFISPEKDFYDFEDSVTFSCPEGKNLTGEMERIKCLESGWEIATVPDCQ